jgi:hypothetical protein
MTHVLFMLCLFIFILWDAFFSARKIRELRLKLYNKWYFYLIFFLALLQSEWVTFEHLELR